jgi:hypothetical protein
MEQDETSTRKPRNWRASLAKLLIGAIIATLPAYPANAATGCLIARLCQSYTQQQPQPGPRITPSRIRPESK